MNKLTLTMLNMLLATKLVKVLPNRKTMYILKDSLGINRLGKVDFICKKMKWYPRYVEENYFNSLKGR